MVPEIVLRMCYNKPVKSTTHSRALRENIACGHGLVTNIALGFASNSSSFNRTLVQYCCVLRYVLVAFKTHKGNVFTAHNQN